jgi:hypothetical protein
MTEDVSSSETSGNFYKTKQYDIPEDSHPHDTQEFDTGVNQCRSLQITQPYKI